jgi:hypothetical protein
MNMVGTLRVASLMGYSALNAAGYALRDLVRDMDEFNVKALSVEERATRAANFNQRFRDALASVGEGGLQYRIDRAMFYVREFRTECQAMAFGRIEGFQPYPSFAQRRLGQTWGFIETLYRRCQQLTQRLSGLNEEIRAEQALAQTTELNNQTEELRELQRFAENAATIPIAYYGGHVLSAAVFWFEWVLAQWRLIALPERQADDPFLILYMIVAALLYRRLVVRNPSRRRPDSTASASFPAGQEG